MSNRKEGSCDIPAQETHNEELMLGCAKVDITPQKPLALAGFAHRQGNYESVIRPLNARILYFQQGQIGKTLLVSADLLWWGSEQMEGLRGKLRERFGLLESQIMFHATHNHSGPQTSVMYTPSLGKPDIEYIRYLEDCILDGVDQAVLQLETVTVERGIGRCDLSVHRRKMVDGTIHMAPNLEGFVDPDVNVIRLCASGGRTKGLLVHYACHPTTTGENVISSEFPGVAMELIEEKLGDGAISAYLQGCCADVRPALVRDGEFYRGGDDEVCRIGRALADEVLAIVQRPMKRLEAGLLDSRSIKVQLPLQDPPALDDLLNWAGVYAAQSVVDHQQAVSNPSVGGGHEDTGRSTADANPIKQLMPDAEIVEKWSQLLLINQRYKQRYVELELEYLQLAEGLVLLTSNAELVGAYSRFIKASFEDTVLPVGYTNGMIGYVPTAAQLSEGGYEAVDYIYYFGLPAPLAPEAETIIHNSIVKLVAQK
ncbi:neutral/alkaline non-lysosomal ceramidase N-terminal domain-containing protein [Paenibacillus agricola]|uniref:Neutral/alkaline non-lysosomal ceramidase N-terminal domain-containing protein n=1 Tax=Paenibacillus agricola TaxID=2716264 RepID=A0ABX0J9U6_9BACL|nr:neutral/alkaline non-lysosomal ceramidase N-terminal domain-containing protein [Paenibacillus agricola]NHN31647.1 hypothetical protein [Paenibacillus agricola]